MNPQEERADEKPVVTLEEVHASTATVRKLYEEGVIDGAAAFLMLSSIARDAHLAESPPLPNRDTLCEPTSVDIRMSEMRSRMGSDALWEADNNY